MEPGMEGTLRPPGLTREGRGVWWVGTGWKMVLLLLRDCAQTCGASRPASAGVQAKLELASMEPVNELLHALVGKQQQQAHTWLGVAKSFGGRGASVAPWGSELDHRTRHHQRSELGWPSNHLG